MQLFNIWPDIGQLAIPSNVKTALIQHLIEPFQDEAAAKAYWLEHHPTLIILEDQDTSESIAKIDSKLQHKIAMAQTNPEYIEEIAENYAIRLAILNDLGEGVYCLQKNRFAT
ncbi:MAG: hypothetical protein GQ532_13050 [Methylomarinum sp.]|nr:hypothetical protein [Methylomarinum sp.]